LLETIGEFDRSGGASLGLVASELSVEQERVANAWNAARATGLIKPASVDRVVAEQLWRLSADGWRALRQLAGFLTCPICADVIGVYEPAVVARDDQRRRTSIAREPHLRSGEETVMHLGCAPDNWDLTHALWSWLAIVARARWPVIEPRTGLACIAGLSAQQRDQHPVDVLLPEPRAAIGEQHVGRLADPAS
jgi:hypothetical protein